MWIAGFNFKRYNFTGHSQKLIHAKYFEAGIREIKSMPKIYPHKVYYENKSSLVQRLHTEHLCEYYCFMYVPFFPIPYPNLTL